MVPPHFAVLHASHGFRRNGSGGGLLSSGCMRMCHSDQTGIIAQIGRQYLSDPKFPHMDILSHGLWGGIALGRSSRKSFWTAVLFGMAPDLFSFGPLFAGGLWLHGLEFLRGLGHPPDASLIPAYVYQLYNLTHSLLVFGLVFGVVWLLRGKPLLEMGAWGLHLGMDILTHNDAFFPTPFLWPLSDAHFDGLPWGDLRIFVPNVVLLALLYAWFFVRRRKAGRADAKPGAGRG